MKVLAIETSSMVISVALTDNDRLLAEYMINHKKTHSQMLMPLIDKMIEDLSLMPSEIDLFAASNGPGSFTGIRIGVASAKSMAQALNKPVVGISGLDALSHNMLHFKGIICPIIDARREQVYTCVYDSDSGCIRRLGEYMAVRIDELAFYLRNIGQKVMFCGDGVDIHKDKLSTLLGENALFAQPELRMQRASSIASLALKRANENKTMSYIELQPLYLRKSQAEQKYDSGKL